MSQTDDLELGYQFDPSPSPIYASADSNNLNLVNLRVTVSNPTNGPAILSKLEIHIPVGADIDGDLSPANNLPAPILETAAIPNVSITSKGSTVMIAPADGTVLTVSVTAQIIFSLPHITVGTFAGGVPVAITEFPVSGPKRRDAKSHRLNKEQTTWPVTRFWTEPSSLTKLNQKVKLKWSCNKLGKDYSYSLSAPRWQPTDCVQTGNCYDAEDGVNGISSLALTDTTEFTLTVVRATEGSRTIVGTSTTQTVVEPQPTIKCFETKWRGKLLELSWDTEDATSVEIDPPYLLFGPKGKYPFDTSAQPLPYSFTLTARYGTRSNPATSKIVPQGFRPALGSPVRTGTGCEGVAVSPDGTLVFVTNSGDHTLTVLDAQSLQPVGAPIPVGRGPVGVAVSPDGKRVFVANLGGNQDGNTLSVLDVLDQKTLRPAANSPVTVGTGPWAVAVSPCGSHVFVTNSNSHSLTVLDAHTLQPVGSPIPLGTGPTGVAVSSHGDDLDRSRIFVANRGYVPSWGNTLTVLNAKTLQPVGSPVRVGNGPSGVAVSPDGKLVFVTNAGDNTLTVLDEHTLQPVHAPIPVGLMSKSPFVSHDGARLFVVNSNSTNLSVLDARTFQPVGAPIRAGNWPSCVAVSPVGPRVFVTNTNDGTVTVLDPEAYAPAPGG